MAAHDSHLKMTSDDLRAARVLTLAVKFFGTSRTIPSSTIATELYPGLDENSFMRQFLRDRELLATFGLVIREVDSDAKDSVWKVDEEASYVKGGELSAHDARMLYVLCYDMAFDRAFPYRDELRLALAKIARMYRGATVAHTDATTAREHKTLAVLVSCMSAHHAAAVTYTDAQGVTSERTIAPLGAFGLREQTYFVASRVSADGSLVPDSIRTYRLDRFDKVRELPKLAFQVPADFAVGDYERLPFQMGDPCGQACFAVDPNASSEVMRAMETHGSVCSREGQLLWEVPYHDVDAAASWAIGADILPCAPPELCHCWHEALVRTTQAKLHDAVLDRCTETEQVSQARRRAGRTGSVATARQLIALATSLTSEGEVITAQDIAASLGISYDDARHLIALVSLGSGESIDYLPVILSDDDDEVSLMEGAALSARRVRLTRAESMALSAALAELGIDESDPLARTLSDAYAAPSFTTDDVLRTIEAPSSTDEGKVLRLCSAAIAAEAGLAFTYQPVTGDSPSRRRVIPQMVRHGDDNWYLEAFDLMRRDRRVFRIDRMSEVEQVEARMPALTHREREAQQRLVTLRFTDLRYLDLFHWEGMRTVSRNETSTTISLPVYSGSWLARHIAACAGTVQTGDTTLAAQAQAYAQDRLKG